MPKAVKLGASAGLHQDRARRSRTKNSCHRRDEAVHLVICRKLLQLYSIVPDPLALLVQGLELPLSCPDVMPHQMQDSRCRC